MLSLNHETSYTIQMSKVCESPALMCVLSHRSLGGSEAPRPHSSQTADPEYRTWPSDPKYCLLGILMKKYGLHICYINAFMSLFNLVFLSTQNVDCRCSRPQLTIFLWGRKFMQQDLRQRLCLLLNYIILQDIIIWVVCTRECRAFLKKQTHPWMMPCACSKCSHFISSIFIPHRRKGCHESN